MKGRTSAADGDPAGADREKGVSEGTGPAQGRRAVFLDRDGTLVRETHYLTDPSRLALLPGAGRAVAKLNAAGFAVVVVTNQSGVARGLSTEDRVRQIHAKLIGLTARHGARLDGIYFCPHHPEGSVQAYRKVCSCRKPGTGLFVRARDELALNLAGSYHIGDKRSDVEAAARAGLVSILVLSGYGRKEWEACLRSGPGSIMPDRIARGLAEAAEWVLWRESRQENGRGSCLWLSRKLVSIEAARWRRAGRKILLGVDRPFHPRVLPMPPLRGGPSRQWVLVAIDPSCAARVLPPGQGARWVARRIQTLSRLTGVDAVTLVWRGSELSSLVEAIRPDAVLDLSKGLET